MKIMGAKARLLQYLDYKGIEKPDFYTETGLSNGYLDKNDNMNSDKLEIVVRCYPDLNLNWLISGVEPMIDPNTDNVSVGEPTNSYRTYGNAQRQGQGRKVKDKELEERLKDKDETIAALKETINVYRRLVENPQNPNQSTAIGVHS